MNVFLLNPILEFSKVGGGVKNPVSEVWKLGALPRVNVVLGWSFRIRC